MKPFGRSASAPRTLPPRPLRLIGGAAIAVAVALMVGLLFASIIEASVGQKAGAGSTPDIAHLLRMSAIQAGLSTVFSIGVGIGLAWALNRLRFPGRALVVGLFSSAIVTPGLIVAFGLIAIWGRNGWINHALEAFGTSLDVPVFGLAGIVAAHVILDGAFAARVLLARLDAVPDKRLKTGQSLDLGAWTRFRVIDWPAMAGSLPGLSAIIFLLAFTSFPIVLLLGGGPANQTFEVAIYSAVRLDFDLRGAVLLALIQIGVCAAIVITASAATAVPVAPGRSPGQNWPDRGAARAFQIGLLLLGGAGFSLPLLSVLTDGLGPGLALLPARTDFWSATATSLAIGALSACLALALALALSLARAATGTPLLRTVLGAPAYVYLAVPAVVLSLGFFLLVRAAGIEPGRAGPAIVILANALLASPFAVATLGPPLDALVRERGRLLRSLGLSGFEQFRLIEWPLIGRDVGVAAALAFCFSLGDLGVVALFGTKDFTTLPLLMLRALGAYRTEDAAGIAALMLVLTIAVFVALPPLFSRLTHARA